MAKIHVIYLVNKQPSIFCVPGHVLGTGNGDKPWPTRSSQSSGEKDTYIHTYTGKYAKGEHYGGQEQRNQSEV